MPEPRLRPRPGLRVGRFLGVPVIFAPSWLLLTGFVTVVYAPFVSEQLPGIGASRYLVSLGFALMLALSVLLHEMAHVAVGVALRLDVTRVTLFGLGGVSEMSREPADAGGEYLVAMSGPLVSLVLGAGALAVLDLASEGSTGSLLVAGLAVTNLLVAAANLLPGLPLDGGRVLRAGVWAVVGDRLRGTVVSAWLGRAVGLALLVLAVVVTATPAGTVVDGLLITVMAVFLYVGAGVALRNAGLAARLPQVTVAGLLRPAIGVTARTPLSEAVRQARARGVGAVVVVDSDGRPEAIVDEAAVRRTAPDRQPWTEVAAVAHPVRQGQVLPVDLAGQALADRIAENPAPAYLVVDAEWRIRGVLTTADVQRALVASGTGRTGP